MGADDSGIYHETGLTIRARSTRPWCARCGPWGMMPEMVYHEGGPGQQEISIHHEHALKAPTTR